MNAPATQSGLTLVEVLVTMVLLTILLVPAMQALHTGSTGAGVHGSVVADQFRLRSRMEELLAEPFADLEAAAIAAGAPTVPSSYSEPAGSPGRLLVYLSPYDGDNADSDDNALTGGDPGLLWVRVDAENSIHSLQSVKARGF